MYIHFQLQQNLNLAYPLQLLFLVISPTSSGFLAFLRLFSSFIRIVRSECTLFLHFNSGFSQWLSQLYLCRTTYTHTLVFPLQFSLVVRNGSLSVKKLSRSLVSCSQLIFVSVLSNFCVYSRYSQFVHSLYIRRFWLHTYGTHH